jgi:hypothetical protein
MSEAEELKALRAQNEGLQAMIDAIHDVFDNYDDVEAGKHIREVLYGSRIHPDEWGTAAINSIKDD